MNGVRLVDNQAFSLDERFPVSNVIGGVMTPPYETQIKDNLPKYRAVPVEQAQWRGDYNQRS